MCLHFIKFCQRSNQSHNKISAFAFRANFQKSVNSEVGFELLDYYHKRVEKQTGAFEAFEQLFRNYVLFA